VLNELKRYIKYNSEKLNFLKLRNKFFDRLRNRGFRKYTLSKLFSAVKYSSRNKLLATNDTIYSTVVQETQAEMALIEIAEEIFSRRLNEEPTIPQFFNKELKEPYALLLKFYDGDDRPTKAFMETPNFIVNDPDLFKKAEAYKPVYAAEQAKKRAEQSARDKERYAKSVKK